jgi:hypothetical protein
MVQKSIEKMENKEKFIIVLLLLFSLNVTGQRTFKIHNDVNCSKKGKTLATLKNIKGELILGTDNVITYRKNNEIFKIIPCNLPKIVDNRSNIKVQFSGRILEGNIAVKSIGATIVLTKLVLLNN